MTRDLVFLDTETTHLDAEKGQVWEIAYAINEGPVQAAFVPHTLHGANPEALVIGRYMERWQRPERLYTDAFEADLMEALDDATLVGANPRFDAAFLKKRWSAEPWHYRLLDVCAYVAGAKGLGYVPGLSEAAEMMGFGDLPDHTAANDVLATQEAFYAAKKLHAKEEEVPIPW